MNIMAILNSEGHNHKKQSRFHGTSLLTVKKIFLHYTPEVQHGT